MTAGDRLRLLSGAGDTSAAARLRRIAGVAGLAGAMLVAYSGLPTATAAVHLLHERVVEETPPATGVYGGGYDLEQHVRDSWDLLEARRAAGPPAAESPETAGAAAPPPAQRAPGAPAAAAAEPAVVKISAAQAQRLEQLLPAAGNDAERALLLALVLADSQAAPTITVTATPGAAPLTEDELAVVTLLLAQHRLH